MNYETEYKLLEELGWHISFYSGTQYMFEKKNKLIWPYRGDGEWCCANLDFRRNCYNHRFGRDLYNMILMENFNFN